MNLIRLRYADTPGLLDTTQLISGYQLQRNAFVGVASDTFPIRPNGGLAAQLQESPTFTFQPVTGDAYAHSFLRPLPPTTLLPLAMGGLPIDILLRLSVQSINMMSNNRPFSKNKGDIENHSNSKINDFYELTHDLRLLQAAGLLGIQLQQTADKTGKAEETHHVYLSITSTNDPALLDIVRKTRELLNFSPKHDRMEVVYGVGEPQPGEIRILSRSMLSILGQVAYQIEVPDDEVTSGSTTPHINVPDQAEDQSLITVYSSHNEPKQAFVHVFYDNYYYWIDKKDFESKLAFTITQMLFELSKTSQTPGALVTIPVSK
ncbi:MAG: hypothetical protein SOH81_12655 [Acetobacter sp.]